MIREDVRCEIPKREGDLMSGIMILNNLEGKAIQKGAPKRTVRIGPLETLKKQSRLTVG